MTHLYVKWLDHGATEKRPMLMFRMSYIKKAFVHRWILDPLGTQGWVGSAGTLHTFIALPAELPHTCLSVWKLVISEQQPPDTLTWEEKGMACPRCWVWGVCPPRPQSWSGLRHLALSPLSPGPEAVSLSTGETGGLEGGVWSGSLRGTQVPAQHSTGDRLFHPASSHFPRCYNEANWKNQRGKEYPG